MEKLRKILVLVMVLVFSAVALCDWNQDDGHKMHYAQTPNPDGWDVCVCCQWIADDFTCSRTGPIDDIHFWISWMRDDVGDVPPNLWEIAIYDDATGAPGNRLWSLQNATIVVRGPSPGDQGWVCPSPLPTIQRPDHVNYYQVNITEIAEPFTQKEGTTYWLVIKANIPPEPTAVGWKTAETIPYQKPAMWTQTPTDPASWRLVLDTVDDIYDMAFVITGREEEPPLDFGDAPDNTPVGAGYPTLIVNNGANHVIGGPWLGDDSDAPDAEPDGQPDITATGDDNDGNDDENGVQIPVLTQGTTSTITVEVNGGGGFLTVWIDWNGDMDWIDGDEMVYQSAISLSDGNYNISVTPPSTSVVGQTFLRARISSLSDIGPGGGAPDGEVEDHKVSIEEPADLDFGDAPDSAGAMQYPTLFASDGARHLVVPGIMLGNQIDAEADGQPTSDADGDDLNNLDDEDGVVFTSTLIPGKPATVDVTASIDGYLNVWIDYNGDYSWDEAGDHVFADEPIGMGTTTLGFTVPATATPGIETFARFRFTSPNITGIGYKGYTRDGEVEDYKVKIDKPIIKWSQPPMYKDEDDDCFWGWNEESVYGVYEEREMQIVADDWLCMDYRPITDIHWWGSYLNWREDIPPDYAPERFHIGIWTDVPADADTPWSRPGKMIWQWVVPRAELWERPVGCDYHEDYEDVVDTCFRYDLQLPEDVWFWQEGPETIYWISISAIYSDVPPEQNIWGWKTREHYFNDDAVRIFKPTAPMPGDVFDSGEPIYDNAGNSWDMAFELTTQECLTPSTAVFPPGHPSAGINYYAEWASWGYPKCWCYARQCWGDADGLSYGTEWTGIYYVGTPDLGILATAWMVKEPDFGLGIATIPNGICADFDHTIHGTEWTGLYRVGTPDLGILATSWMVKEIPDGPGVPADCGGTILP